MSLAVKATRSAAWMLAGSLVSRAAGLVSTLVVIRFVSPTDYGEAIAGSIIVGTASQLSSLGIGQFVIVKGGGRRDLAFHATVFQLLLGLLAVAIILLVPRQLNSYFNAPGLSRYTPALALSMLIDRASFVPERTLMRSMRFRAVSFARSAGELTYSGAAVAMAVLGWGGMAIALANVARSIIRALIMIPLVKRRDWLEPCRLRLDATLEVLRFGGPLSIGAFAGFIASKWDNLLVSRFFGAAVMGEYNLAYSLAGMAPGLVAEQIADVLVPSMAQADAAKRPDALVRTISLLMLVSTPLCIGLAAVSPTLVGTVLDPRWAGVTPMLAILSAATVFAGLIGMVFAYLQATDQPRHVMFLQVFAAVAVLSSIYLGRSFGAVWTCCAVAFAAAVCFVAAVLVTARSVNRASPWRLVSTHVGPLLASAPMVAFILVTRWFLERGGIHIRYVNLAIEVGIGAIAYAVSALLVARSSSLDLIRLFRAAFSRGRGAETS